MIDKIKFSIKIANIALQNICRTGRPKRDKLNRKYVPIVIPNGNNTENLIFRYYECADDNYLEGNLRRWWFGKKAIADLDYSSLKKALKLISKRLGILESELYNSEIIRLELGANIRLEPKHASIIQMLMTYPNLPRDRYNKSTVYFMGKKYSIIFYDKLLEMKDNGLIKDKVYRTLSKYMFVLRIEKKIIAKSGITFGSKVHTLEDILENWEFLVDDWLDTLHKVNYIDLFDKTKEINQNSLTKKEFKEFLIYQALLQLQLEKCLDLARFYLKDRKGETIGKLIKLFNGFKDEKKKGYFTEVSNIAARKANKMKNGIPKYLNYESALNNIESNGTITE